MFPVEKGGRNFDQEPGVLFVGGDQCFGCKRLNEPAKIPLVDLGLFGDCGLGSGAIHQTDRALLLLSGPHNFQQIRSRVLVSLRQTRLGHDLE